MSAAEGVGGAGTVGRRAALLAFVLALPLYLALVWRFDFVCDDAFIFFRYAENLAAGHGLRFDPSESVPVEGYSSLAWPILLAVLVRAGLDPALWVDAVTVPIGIVFFVYLISFARRRLALGTAQTSAVALFLAAFPPFALWTTSGMPELFYALAVFAVFERLLGDPLRPHGVQAGACALLAALLRVEGAFFALFVLLLGVATWWFRRDRSLARALRVALAILVLGVAAHWAWRYAYHGDFLANTVRTKGGVSGARLVRGLLYCATWLAVFPGMAFALAAPLFGGLRRQRALCLQAWAVCAASLGFATAVGGDFMPMGRFLLTAVPFAVLSLAAWLSGPPSPAKMALALAAGAASLAAAFDLHLVPLALRERLGFRAEYWSEFVSWRASRENTARWSALGRALSVHTRPSESLVYGYIGAVGYYSHLHLFDQFGLVTRLGELDPVWTIDGGDPGHDRFAPAASFLSLQPTYLDARLVPKGSLEARSWRRDGPWSAITETSYHPVDELVPGLGEVELELVRFTSWDWVGTPFYALVEVARDVDLSDATGASTRVLERADSARERLERAEGEIRAMLREGRLFDVVEPFGVRQISRGEQETLGHKVAVWCLSADGPAHPAPTGAVVRSFALDGDPTLDGAAPGWSIVSPGGVHELRVEGGSLLVVCIRPPERR